LITNILDAPPWPGTTTAQEPRLVSAELEELTGALQRLLLPPRLPEIEGIDLASCFLPASRSQVGGDFFDLFPLGAGAWGLAVGDVCGKGPTAAAVAAAARHALRAAAIDRRQPSEALAVLNEALLLDNDEEIEPRFCTAVYGRLRPYREGFRITVACGGHPHPLVLHRDGTVTDIGASGTLLGVLDQPDLTDHRLFLRSGDAVLLFSDGLTEAPRSDGTLLGREGIGAVLRAHRFDPLPEIVGALRAEAISGATQRDDLAILALRVR
jgi:sigma-B regulation protein RsbU (phosphoserine phosphatase)